MKRCVVSGGCYVGLWPFATDANALTLRLLFRALRQSANNWQDATATRLILTRRFRWRFDAARRERCCFAGPGGPGSRRCLSRRYGKSQSGRASLRRAKAKKKTRRADAAQATCIAGMTQRGTLALAPCWSFFWCADYAAPVISCLCKSSCRKHIRPSAYAILIFFVSASASSLKTGDMPWTRSGWFCLTSAL
jgi:hypothetical protein